ncbi:Apoptosis inhibitor IAP [Nymphon striatum]|nr:Apoptosis inhibitor IAP [Nymphon striatum]
MANLPQARMDAYKPAFTNTGIDIFGPFYVKHRRSQVKRYGCIFTCMTTRAVHLEKVYDLSTNSFINGFRRFVCRRGYPEKVYSDNGTNFVGGESELRRSLSEISKHEIEQYAVRHNIEWHFNPPSASHMGGAWERIIRSIRRILSGMILEIKSLTDETLDTLFCEIESILNGRPLTKLSDDVLDPTPLTPNHLLMLKEGPSLPPGKFDEDICKKRWRHVQHLSNVFWRRWLRVYLPELQRRQKWLDHIYVCWIVFLIVCYKLFINNEGGLCRNFFTSPGPGGMVCIILCIEHCISSGNWDHNGVYTEVHNELHTVTNTKLDGFTIHVLRSFRAPDASWPHENIVSALSLARAGFFYDSFGTTCFYCNGHLTDWEAGDNAFFEHARWRPHCGYIKMVKGRNYIKECLLMNPPIPWKPSTSALVDVNGNFSPPEDVKRPLQIDITPIDKSHTVTNTKLDEFAIHVLNPKTRSFRAPDASWPHENIVSALSLARAGFFYDSFGTTCFYCNGHLTDGRQEIHKPCDRTKSTPFAAIGNPFSVAVHCVCHRLALAVPNMAAVERIIASLYHFIQFNTKRLWKFKDQAEILDLDIVKFKKHFEYLEGSDKRNYKPLIVLSEDEAGQEKPIAIVFWSYKFVALIHLAADILSETNCLESLVSVQGCCLRIIHYLCLSKCDQIILLIHNIIFLMTLYFKQIQLHTRIRMNSLAYDGFNHLSVLLDHFGQQKISRNGRTLFGINTSRQSSTKFSSIFLMFGRNPRLFSELALQESRQDEDDESVQVEFHIDQYQVTEEMMAERVNVMSAIKTKVDQNISKAQARQKKYYQQKKSKGYKCFDFRVGMSVLSRNNRKVGRKGHRMKNDWLGPYVICKLSNGCVELTNNSQPLKSKVSISNIKPYLIDSKEKSVNVIDNTVTMDSPSKRIRLDDANNDDTKVQSKRKLLVIKKDLSKEHETGEPKNVGSVRTKVERKLLLLSPV